MRPNRSRGAVVVVAVAVVVPGSGPVLVLRLSSAMLLVVARIELTVSEQQIICM